MHLPTSVLLPKLAASHEVHPSGTAALGTLLNLDLGGLCIRQDLVRQVSSAGGAQARSVAAGALDHYCAPGRGARKDKEHQGRGPTTYVHL